MLVILKRFRILFLLFLILIVVILLKVFGPSVSPAPSVSSVVLPSVQPVVNAPTSLQYSFEKAWPNFPSSLPIYKISQLSNLSLAEAKKISANFGFTSEPQTAQDLETGTFYNWSENNHYLSIGGKPPTISFGPSSFANVATASAALSQTAGLDLTKKTLEEKGLTNPLINLDHPSFTYYSVNGEQLKEVADFSSGQIMRISFNYLLSGVPLLNNNPSAPAVSLFFDGSGNLIKLDYIKYPTAFEKTGDVSVLSSQQAIADLTSQKGTIVSFVADSEKNLETPVNYQVSSAQIASVSLAYYYPKTPDEKTLVPIFVFKGEGNDPTGKVVKFTTYLPATPGP